MQVKMRKVEKESFDWFARNCIKAAQEHKFTNYYYSIRDLQVRQAR